MVKMDEMNIFIPQSVQTVIELEEIADVQKQMIVAKSSRTVIGIIQDGLIGAYNITHDKMRIGWRHAMNMLANTSFKNFESIQKDKEYTGKEIYSFIIPPNINIDRNDITIKNSQIVKGRLNKSILGEGGKNNLIQSILDEHGSKIAKDFIDNTLRLINNFNLYNGFTVGIGDLYIPKDLNRDIQNMFAKVDIALEHKITHLENNPDYMNANMFESQIFSDLNIIRDNVSKIVMENFDEMNKFKIMALSGSKGNATNMGQMAGCVGLQTIGGMVVKKCYNNRTLPYFHQHDDRSLARGLIKNSFLLGESFSEFVFQMTAGRAGIIDQVVRTSDTGYVQRKLIKMLEDVMVKYDGTIRSASNSLIQLVYGDCGADTTKQYEYKIKILDMGDNELNDKYNSSDKVFKRIKKLRNDVRKLLMNATLDTKTFNTSFMFPVNLLRIINNTKEIKIGSTKLTEDYVIDTLEQLLYNKNTPIIYIRKDQQNNNESFKVRDDYDLKYLFKLALYDALAPKIVIDEYKLTQEMFDSIIDKIKTAFNKNIVEPGEMVGIIAAQSMAEPLTQLNLNSVDWTEKIIIHNKKLNETHVIEIGKWIDDLIKDNKNVKHIGDNIDNEMGDTYYLDINDKDYIISSVDEKGNVTWKKIEAVTKHLPINRDGTHTLLKIKTKLGKEVTATKAKSFLTINNKQVVPIRGDELKVGMYVPVIKDFPELEWNDLNDMIKLDKYFGFLCGAYIANGYVTNKTVVICNYNHSQRDNIIEFAKRNSITYFDSDKNNYIQLESKTLASYMKNICGHIIEDKHVPDFSYIAPMEFCYGLLTAYFNNNHSYIHSVSKNTLITISTLLTRFGIVSTIENSLPDSYKLVINEEYNDNNTITNIYCDEIVSITEVEPTHKYVYDLTVQDTKNFGIINGLLMRDK